MKSFTPFRCRLLYLAFCALVSSALLHLPALAWAAPLDKTSCAKLAQDLQNLKALEVDKLMENGPSWAVAHLSSGDLGLIRQYIDLDEQMKFRCSAPSSLVHLKHLEDEDEDNGGAKPGPDASESGTQKDQGESSQGEGASSGQTDAKVEK
jgi:hypothetical protein